MHNNGNLHSNCAAVEETKLDENSHLEKVTTSDSFIKSSYELIERVKQREKNQDLNINKDKSEKGFKETQSARLIWLASAACEVFHTSENEAFASVFIGDHKQTKKINSTDFREWLGMLFYYAYGTMPSSQAIQDVVNGISGKAKYEGSEIDVHLRIAEHEGSIYLDLCNEAWQVAVINKDGWSISDNSPIKFRRTRGMLPLPTPKYGGDIKELREYVNVTDEGFTLVLAWLVACFRPDRPFPILVLQGEQGSAKTTTARVLRHLVDSNKALLRSQPRNEHDLIIAANNSWLVAFDNLSNLSGELSDSICRLSTGGGFATRQLYSDNEEILFSVMRPVLLNGINDLVSRSDLLDRALMLNLPRVEKRIDETTFWKNFDAARPRILGAMLSAVSAALANIEPVTQQIKQSAVELPRLADFTLWAMSAEAALQIPSGEFLRLYRGNREAIHDSVLDLDPLAELLFKFMSGKAHYSGLPADLLDRLKQIAGEDLRRSKDFPTNPRSLGVRLSRLAPNLRARGLDYISPDRSKRSENRHLSLIHTL